MTPAIRPDDPLAAHPVRASDILHEVHLLEADAGTGKTWTLSGLVLRALIERELTIDQILVVTFTIPATAELSRRIAERIDQLIAVLQARLEGHPIPDQDIFCRLYGSDLPDPDQALRRLKLARAQIDEAAVRTIHGFCQRVIIEHALSIGQPRDLSPQADTGLVLQRVVARWWRENLLDAEPGVVDAVRLGGVTPALLAQAVGRIAAQPSVVLRAAPRPWRDIAREFSASRHRLAELLADPLEGERLLAWLKGPQGVAPKDFQRPARDKALAGLASFVRHAGPLKAAPDRKAMADGVRRLAASTLGPIAAGDPAVLELTRVCDELHQRFDLVDQLTGWIAVDLWQQTESLRESVKREAAAMGFDDLLRLVHRALISPQTGDRLAAGLRRRYPLALIDECQDTDPLQWEIFRRIYLSEGDGSDQAAMVMVGDPKQAIYAFRGADVYAYLEARAGIARRLGLDENQRSTAELIAAVNAVFAVPNPFLIPEITFSGARVGTRARKAFMPAPDDRQPSLVFARVRCGDPGRMLTRPHAQGESLDAMAGEIRRLLEGGTRIDDRPVRAADIAVLVNSHWEASLVKQRLARDGIGAAEISRDSVLDATECDELLRLCDAIAHPADPGRLLAALATGLCGGTAGPVQALLDDPPRWGAEVDRFLLAGQTWVRLGPRAALSPLLAQAGAFARLGGLQDGERRLTNLSHLIDLLSRSDEARRSPAGAMSWLMRQRAGAGQLASELLELRLESNDDLVRVVTIHKSKGLEYDFVFLPFAWAGREPKADLPLHFHEALARSGRWRAVLDFGSSGGPDAVAQARRESAAEALRVLYVALTRARFRCYVFWGPVVGAQFAPLAWLLHGKDPVEQKAWKNNHKPPPPLNDDEIDQGLAALISRVQDNGSASPPIAAIEASALMRPSEARATQGASPEAPGDAVGLHARALRRPLPPARVRSSFTALLGRLDAVANPSVAGGQETDGEGEGTAVRQEFSALPDRDPIEAPAAVSPDDIPVLDAASGHDDSGPARAATRMPSGARALRFAFPAGARAGTCLHQILEQCDFALPPPVPLVARCLTEAGYDPALAAGLADWLAEVLDTPLEVPGAAPIRLCTLPVRRLSRELEFLLPVDGLDTRALIDAVASEFPLDRQAAAGAWSGFLQGFVDLIFEDQGRWWILDWKSNHLGDRVADYGRAGLEASIAEHAYALQFCLYSLALHRLLKLRLPGYEPARHFGGVLYLYLRGVGLADPDRQSGGAPGVYAVRPSEALLARLDQLFGSPS